ncbi:MAG: molybdopterin cofactor-binding domain-containing protein, partial [Pseudomonadota bacterium]
LALGADHKFLGVRVKNMANLGAYMSTFASLIPTYVYAPMLSGQYRIPAIYAEVDAVYTNTAPVDAYRGAGRPEATYAIERIIDVAAYELNVDPVELRRKNFITDFPYQTPVEMEYDVGDYASSLDRALDMIDYDGFPKRREASETAGKKRGIGVATYIEASGIGPSAKLAKLGAGSGLWESAEIRVNPTGSVEVLTGCHSHGQSHETTYAQLVAQRFGIPVDQVELLHGDTDKVQFGMGTYGSRSGPVGMSAVALACDKVVVKARQIAGHLMAVPFSSVKFEEGIFSSEQTEQTLAFPEVAIAAYMAHSFPTTEIEPGLKEGCYFDPPNFSFPAGCYICEVEIDPETGITDIVDFIAVDDFGNIINPMVVDGQVHGGVAQGIGQALLEHAIYDKDSGQLLTGSYMDYCMPRADDLPVFRTDNTVTPSTTNPLGLKGCGEAGAIGAPPAVISAISNALGIAHIDMPATPERVWRAIQKGANAR